MRSLTAGAVAALLLVSLVATPGTLAAGCQPETAFENDLVRLWFHGKKPFIQVHDKETGGMYQYKSSAIEEVDAEGAVVRSLNLERAYPQDSVCSVEENEEFVHMAITVTSAVRDAGDGEVGTASVTLEYHWNKTAAGAKFDLLVEDWPWADDADQLNYGFSMASEELVLEPAENGVGVRDADGNAIGYVDWAPNATVTYSDETMAEALTDSSWTGDNHSLALDLLFTNVTGGYVALDMDPWFGVGSYVIVAGYLIGLAPVEQALPPEAAKALRALL